MKNLFEILKYWLKSKKGEMVVVYQMGKVGSKSIDFALRNAGYRNVIHLHSIRQDSRSYYARKLYRRLKIEEKQTIIISAVREPISRNVSAFFESLHAYIDKDWRSYTANELFEIFKLKYQHKYPVHWFETELEYNTGYDIFDKSSVLPGHISLIVLRKEDDSEFNSGALSNFLGTQLRVKRHNVTGQKEYSEVYREVLLLAQNDRDYCMSLENTKFYQFFYGSESSYKAIMKNAPNKQ